MTETANSAWQPPWRDSRPIKDTPVRVKRSIHQTENKSAFWRGALRVFEHLGQNPHLIGKSLNNGCFEFASSEADWDPGILELALLVQADFEQKLTEKGTFLDYVGPDAELLYDYCSEEIEAYCSDFERKRLLDAVNHVAKARLIITRVLLINYIASDLFVFTNSDEVRTRAPGLFEIEPADNGPPQSRPSYDLSQAGRKSGMAARGRKKAPAALNLDPEIRDKVDARAAAAGLTRSEWISRQIELGLKLPAPSPARIEREGEFLASLKELFTLHANKLRPSKAKGLLRSIQAEVDIAADLTAEGVDVEDLPKEPPSKPGSPGGIPLFKDRPSRPCFSDQWYQEQWLPYVQAGLICRTEINAYDRQFASNLDTLAKSRQEQGEADVEQPPTLLEACRQDLRLIPLAKDRVAQIGSYISRGLL